jgi:hypothetical protein
MTAKFQTNGLINTLIFIATLKQLQTVMKCLLLLTTLDSVCVGEDIHYYENDLSDEIAEAIQEGYNMYIDDLDWHPFMDAVEESYGKYGKRY